MSELNLFKKANARGSTLSERERLHLAASAFADLASLTETTHRLIKIAASAKKIRVADETEARAFNATRRKAPDGGVPESPIDGGKSCVFVCAISRSTFSAHHLFLSHTLSLSHTHTISLSLFLNIFLSLFLSLSRAHAELVERN
jgi:hypothetical protein